MRSSPPCWLCYLPASGPVPSPYPPSLSLFLKRAHDPFDFFLVLLKAPCLPPLSLSLLRHYDLVRDARPTRVIIPGHFRPVVNYRVRCSRSWAYLIARSLSQHPALAEYESREIRPFYGRTNVSDRRQNHRAKRSGSPGCAVLLRTI